MTARRVDAAPAAVLRTAVRVLRELAAEATPAPWGFARLPGIEERAPEYCQVSGGPDEDGYLTRSVASWAEGDDGTRLSQEDGAWVAALHPGIAEPLAVWLESFANDYELMDSMSAYPLAVARVILGGDGR
jgi:hypothetical protein